MRQTSLVRLETARLILRDFEAEDWSAAQRYESDPEVVRYQSFDVLNPEQSRQYIARDIEERRAEFRRIYDLAIILKATGELVGRIGLSHTKPELQEGTIWYLIRRDCWGKGYMTEAAHRMLKLGFGELRMRRIIADTDPANLGSIRVLEKCGFRLESHKKENLFLKGRWCDTLEFALLASEYQAHHSDVIEN